MPHHTAVGRACTKPSAVDTFASAPGAEGELVVTVWTGACAHQGGVRQPHREVVPTGVPVTWTATTLRLVDGKIAAVVGTRREHLGIPQQLGVAAPTASRSGA